MKRRAGVLSVSIVVGMVLSAYVVGVGTAVPTYSEEIANFMCNDIARLSGNEYVLVGAQQVGVQAWEVEPSLCFRGLGPGEFNYNRNGVDVSNVSRGTIESLAADILEEVRVVPSGYVADYGSGGGVVINMVTRSGTNEFRSELFTRTDESLNDLEYREDGTLWGAGTQFDPEPVPVLGSFNEAGDFIRVDHPLANRGGFFNGIDFTGIGVAYGNTSPNDVPVKPLLMICPDGETWAEPSSLPWTEGAINAAQFLDPLNGWVAGETPDGAAFATTADAGATWTREIMPDATYIWDFEMDAITVDPTACNTSSSWILGAALGTYYLDDGSKESIVYRYDGSMWEELWRIPGYGGSLTFDSAGDGEIGIVQNHQDGTATFSVYDAQDFFGAENLICDLEIIQSSEVAHPNEPVKLRLDARDPWGGTITVDTVLWYTDSGDLDVNPDDPSLAMLTTSEPGEARVTCTLPDVGLETSRTIVVSAND